MKDGGPRGEGRTKLGREWRGLMEVCLYSISRGSFSAIQIRTFTFKQTD